MLSKTWQIVVFFFFGQSKFNEARKPWGIMMLQPIWVTFYNPIFACANSSIAFGEWDVVWLLISSHAFVESCYDVTMKKIFKRSILRVSKTITDIIKYLLKKTAVL